MSDRQAPSSSLLPSTVPLTSVLHRLTEQEVWALPEYKDALRGAVHVKSYHHDERSWNKELGFYISKALNIDLWRFEESSGIQFDELLSVQPRFEANLRHARLAQSSPPYICQPTQLRLCELLRALQKNSSVETDLELDDWTLHTLTWDSCVPARRGLLGLYIADFIAYKRTYEGVGAGGTRAVLAVIGELEVVGIEVVGDKYRPVFDSRANIDMDGGASCSDSDISDSSIPFVALPPGLDAVDKVADMEFRKRWQMGLAKMVVHGLTAQEYCNSRLMFAVIGTRFCRAVMVDTEPSPVLALEASPEFLSDESEHLISLASFLAGEAAHHRHLPCDLWNSEKEMLSYPDLSRLLDLYETAYAQLFSMSFQLPFPRLRWDVRSSAVAQKIMACSDKYWSENPPHQQTRLQQLRRRASHTSRNAKEPGGYAQINSPIPSIAADSKANDIGATWDLKRGLKRKPDWDGDSACGADRVREWREGISPDEKAAELPDIASAGARESAAAGLRSSAINHIARKSVDVDPTATEDTTSEFSAESSGSFVTPEEKLEREADAERRIPLNLETLLTVIRESGTLVAFVSVDEMDKLLCDIRSGCPAAQ